MKVISPTKLFIRAAVVAICLDLAGCTPEGGLTPRVLEGDWKLIMLQGVDVENLVTITWEFEEDGDFTFCYDNECYLGTWEWNAAEDELDITYTDGFGDNYVTEFEIDVLDKTTLSGDWKSDGYTYEMEFERVE
ncbi:hypothetical protein [Pontibacter sp. G13]|uniref:hypothetical protein n=1 Tax=Pontibacter sp. G13 TaxID=3074898 RepID=UPI00288C5728|nr:hypothetical protein [Pontibacter sp. G13]WNJ17354.1 hypothetical protein RJD25_21095 [Pontibacter sp. G13]